MREILMEEMARRGQMTFARFMELALYCPNFGYYERTGVAPGQSGDFYTSVSVGEFFGQLLARQFTEWLEGCPGPRQIVEAGSHDGQLAKDILGWLRANRPQVVEGLEYWILEPSARRKESQRATLWKFAGRVRWFDSWQALPPTGVSGVIFANELLDAMPVHRLGWDAKEREWFEWGVGLKDGEFRWERLKVTTATETPGGDSALRTPHSALPEDLLAVLPDEFTTEICPAAAEWWRDAARALKRGKLMTLDYGLAAEQFFTPERKEGTLRAYFQHRLEKDLLARPGEQDLTAQVNFTTIRAAGEAEGLTTELWKSQGQFLTGVVERAVGKGELLERWTPARTRQFQTLTHPEHLGCAFQVLVQRRY